MTAIYRDQEGIKEAIATIENDIKKHLACIEAVKIITLSDKLISIEELNEIVLKGTNFTDAFRVAQLKNIEQAYSYYIQNYGDYNLDNFNDDFTIKKEVVEQIEHEHTAYLNNEGERIYNKLNKVTEILNSIDRSYSNTLRSSYDGIWSVDLSNLHLISVEKERAKF
jgi:hypothetical protein